MERPWLIGLLAALLTLGAAAGDSTLFKPPLYTQASIVNGASQSPGYLAPGTIATIYGEELAYWTRAVTQADVAAGYLPTTLSGTGVRVLVRNIPAGLYYVSPNQINLLIPPGLVAGPAEVRVVRNGVAGPGVEIYLDEFAPALFQLDRTTALATRSDGVINWDQPARPGEVIVLYATGLGPTVPRFDYNEIPRQAAWVARPDRFRLLLDGQPLPAEQVLYVGVAPGFAGLYQINVRLPDACPVDPEIQIEMAGRVSPRGLRLPLRP